MRYAYKAHLQKLFAYAESEGYRVNVFQHESSSRISWIRDTLNEPKTIYLDGRKSLEEQVFLMLHELGHHEIRKDWLVFTERLPIMAHAENVYVATRAKKYMRRDAYLVFSLEEEFLAWDEGYKLALRLDIRLNLERWLRLKTKCLMSYIDYFSNKKK